MNIILNNKTLDILNNYTISDLLSHINSSKSVMVLVNGKKLLYSEYNSYILINGDTVKVIRPLGGG